MKKILLALFILQSGFTFSQVKLASRGLELKKLARYHQILNAVNTQTNEIFVFATDKDTTTVQKYNRAIFYTEGFRVKRPDTDYKSMSGYCFDENGNPDVYWASEDFKKILSVHYDMRNKTSTGFAFELPLTGETAINAFSEHNAFYLFTKITGANKFKLYVFKGQTVKTDSLDFSSYAFSDEKSKPQTLDEILKAYPIEKMETQQLNPLFYTVAKTKMYIEGNQMTLAFDYNVSQTQLFQINLDSFAIREQKIPQPVLAKPSEKANSYYRKGTLYQLKLNDEEMVLAAKDLKTGNLLHQYSATENDTVSFRNSPLYSQSGQQKPSDLKTGKRFLRKLNTADVGISVYKTPDDILLTVGGRRYVTSTGNVILGITLGVAGGANLLEDLFDSEIQTIFFEGLFDDDFNHKGFAQERLAEDYINEFLDQHKETTLVNVFPYRDFYIMCYYDADAKQYVLRKFMDDRSN